MSPKLRVVLDIGIQLRHGHQGAGYLKGCQVLFCPVLVAQGDKTHGISQTVQACGIIFFPQLGSIDKVIISNVAAAPYDVTIIHDFLFVGITYLVLQDLSSCLRILSVFGLSRIF